MLITEMVRIGNKEFRHNYSNEGFYIVRNDGVKYEEAYDVPQAEWKYTETNEKISDETMIEDEG